MGDEIRISAEKIGRLAFDFLRFHGLSAEQAEAMADMLVKAERDGAHSHGLRRLPGTLDTMAHPAFNRAARPQAEQVTPAVIRVDADYGFSAAAAMAGIPMLCETASKLGLGLLAVQNGFHSTALWPVVEEIAERGLVGMSMNPTHAWVAPAGGREPVLGTNPLAFAWPRPGHPPYVFDLATTAAARAEIARYRQEGRPVPEGWGLDPEGNPTTDAAQVLAGVMLPFGGHKGSAIATMIELMAGPMIGDRTSLQSGEVGAGHDAAPCHGELILAFDPALLGGRDHAAAAEEMFSRIAAQGARLPGARRHEIRAQNLHEGIPVERALIERIRNLMQNAPG